MANFGRPNKPGKLPRPEIDDAGRDRRIWTEESSTGRPRRRKRKTEEKKEKFDTFLSPRAPPLPGEEESRGSRGKFGEGGKIQQRQRRPSGGGRNRRANGGRRLGNLEVSDGFARSSFGFRLACLRVFKENRGLAGWARGWPWLVHPCVWCWEGSSGGSDLYDNPVGLWQSGSPRWIRCGHSSLQLGTGWFFRIFFYAEFWDDSKHDMIWYVFFSYFAWIHTDTACIRWFHVIFVFVTFFAISLFRMWNQTIFCFFMWTLACAS